LIIFGQIKPDMRDFIFLTN